MNNEQIIDLTMHDVTGQALDADNVAQQMDVPKLNLIRQHCRFIVFKERLSVEDWQLRTGDPFPAIIYTPRFAFQGNIPLGPNDLFEDVMSNLKGFYLSLLDATIYPLYPTYGDIPRESPFVILHRDAVTMLQAQETT